MRQRRQSPELFQKDSRVNWRRGNSGVLDGWVLGTSQDRIFVRNYYTDKEYWIDLSDVLWVVPIVRQFFGFLVVAGLAAERTRLAVLIMRIQITFPRPAVQRYAFDKPRGEGWMYRLEESDIAALIEANRLVDFTHEWKDGKWVRKDPPFTPTPEEVNAWARRFIGHDAINQWVCVEARAKRLGIWGKCLHCEGEGDVWRTPEDKANAEKWTPTEPPEGDGYQIWETVSEGSPVSPVFATPEELADWMVANDDSITKNTTRDQWLKFIKGPGWAPSLIAQGGTVKAGTEAQP